MEKTEIKKFENFILYYVQGIGINDTPYEELQVKSVGLADKHVVEIDLHSGVFAFNGKPIKYTYNKVTVKHGFRCTPDTLAETQEYINVLKEALDVAFEVQKYCILNGWWAN